MLNTAARWAHFGAMRHVHVTSPDTRTGTRNVTVVASSTRTVTVSGSTVDTGQPAAQSTLEARLEDAEARAEQQRADFLRAIAELENYRKRAAREIDAARQFGVERLAAELLPVADSLAAGIEAAAADPATQIEGQKATLRLLGKAFERAGISGPGATLLTCHLPRGPRLCSRTGLARRRSCMLSISTPSENAMAK